MKLYKYLFLFTTISYVCGSEPMDIFSPWERRNDPLLQEQIAASETLKEAMCLIVNSYPKGSMVGFLAEPPKYDPFIIILHKLAGQEINPVQVMEKIIYNNLSPSQVTYMYHPLLMPTERPYLGDTPYEHDVKQFITKVINPDHEVVTYGGLIEQKKLEIVNGLNVKLEQFADQRANFKNFFNSFVENSRYLESQQITLVIANAFKTFARREPFLELAKHAEEFVLYIREKNLLSKNQYETYVEFTVMLFMSIKELPTHEKLTEALNLICLPDHILLFKDYLKMIIFRDARFKNDQSFNEESAGE
ncbi:hypothetical protein [Candidatus Odyssella thessalonicensis]|uniref:hypothetical protein n=1 Tax=Candidatus Odyssella thessalonicensis TaxID=84647 RepID=UPI000225B939|nr:hypothetical protein [Candidatus Odyssella thessalonicensis]